MITDTQPTVSPLTDAQMAICILEIMQYQSATARDISDWERLPISQVSRICRALQMAGILTSEPEYRFNPVGTDAPFYMLNER